MAFWPEVWVALKVPPPPLSPPLPRGGRGGGRRGCGRMAARARVAAPPPTLWEAGSLRGGPASRGGSHDPLRRRKRGSSPRSEGGRPATEEASFGGEVSEISCPYLVLPILR